MHQLMVNTVLLYLGIQQMLEIALVAQEDILGHSNVVIEQPNWQIFQLEHKLRSWD